MFLAKSKHGRKVAIKVLREAHEGEEETFEALAREASLCVRLQHSAIVQVRAFVEDEGFAALILDYIEGPPLARLMRLAGAVGARLPDRVTWHIMERILAGLAYAHSQKDDEGALAPIVHRDLSPSNVLIDWTGDVKITDFGIAKMLGVSPATRFGLVKGTLGCMAPEQARGEPVDERADVYAAGLLAWRLATGRAPFDPSMEEVELIRAMRYPRLRPIGALRADLPADLLHAVEMALAPELAQRTIDATEFHRIVCRAMDVEKGRADLAELLARWRAALERVKSPKEGTSESSESSGDKKIPTLRYEEVDLLDQAYPTDSPTIEAHALPFDEGVWAAGTAKIMSVKTPLLPILSASLAPRSEPTPKGDARAAADEDHREIPTAIRARISLPNDPARTRRSLGGVIVGATIALLVVMIVFVALSAR